MFKILFFRRKLRRELDRIVKIRDINVMMMVKNMNVKISLKYWWRTEIVARLWQLLYSSRSIILPSVLLVSKGTVGIIIQWTFPPQMMFVTVTGDRLILSKRKFAIYSLIVICVTSPITLTLHFLPPYLQYWQIPCCSLSFLVLSVTISTFSNMFLCLFRAATLLTNCFKVRNSTNCIYKETL